MFTTFIDVLVENCLQRNIFLYATDSKVYMHIWNCNDSSMLQDTNKN